MGIRLADNCLNFWRCGCDPQLIGSSMLTLIQEGEPLILWRSGEKQEVLDEVCKNCDSRFFNIKKRECPVCGSPDFQREVAGANIGEEKDVLKKEVIFMECAGCKTKLQYIIEY